MWRNKPGTNGTGDPPGAARLGLRASPVWLVGYLVLLAYGSVLPFQFVAPCYADGYLLHSFRQAAPTLEDLLVNLLIYMPLGLLLALARNRYRSPIAAMVCAVVLAGAVSLVCELAQLFVVSRVASWTDVVLNVCGGAVGERLGATVRRRGFVALVAWRGRIAQRPYETSLTVLTVGLFLYYLLPFDFVTNAAGLHAAFTRAHMSLAANPLSLDIAELNGAAWFVLLGVLAARAAVQRGAKPGSAFGGALRDGVTVAVVLECVQLLTGSHVFELQSIWLRSLGVVFGAWLGAFLSEAASGAPPWSPGKVPTSLLAGVVLAQCTFLLCASVDVATLAVGGLDLAQVSWLPFELLRQASAVKALCHIAGVGLTYGVIAALLLTLLRRGRVKREGFITVGAAFSLAAVCEALRLTNAEAVADTTTPILAAAPALVALSIVRGWTGLPPPRPGGMLKDKSLRNSP